MVTVLLSCALALLSDQALDAFKTAYRAIFLQALITSSPRATSATAA